MITHIIHSGKTENVNVFNSGEHGICPYCRTAKMYVKKSKNGIKYAALLPGQIHTKSDCSTQEKRVVSYEPSISDPNLLFFNVLHPSVKGSPDTDRSKVDKEKSEEKNDISAVAEDVSAVAQTETVNQPRRKSIRQDRKINSLRSIWKGNLRCLGYDYPYGTKKFGEVVVFPEFVKQFFARNIGEGEHVFYCRFLGCLDSALTLIFYIFWKDGNSRQSRYIILSCEQQGEDFYDEIYAVFQEYYEDLRTHGIRWRAKPDHPDVLIGGDFQQIQFPYCRKYCYLDCKKCSAKSALISSLIWKDKQIYACPGTGRKAKVNQNSK